MADPAQDYFSSLPSPGTPGTPPGVSSSTPASTDAATDYFGSASTQAYHPPANPLDTPAGSEPSDTSDRFTQTDPNDSWLSKGWQQLNKPLTESLLGWGQYREGAGGFERGVEKIASSLTSPLSLLTLAAFAPAGILEGVAGSTLKEALVQGGTKLGEEALTDAAAAANVEKYGAAVQAAKKAQVAGQSIEGAVQQTGMDYGNFRQYGQFLRDNGLKEDDVLGEGLARRVASVGLAKAGFSAERAVAIAKGAETLVNAGFGIDQIHNAVLTLPKATDLLEQGKYDEAAEYITEGAASGLFGVMGLAHGLHSLDTLVPSINTVKDLPLTDASEYLKTIPGMRDVIKGTATAASSALAREHTIEMMNLADVPVPARLKDSAGIGEEAISALHDIFTSKENIKKLQAKQLDMFHAMDTGNDRALAAQLVQSIGWGSHQEDYANQALNGYAAPIRTIEDIASENKQQQLDTYNNLLENQKQIAGLGQQIKLLARDFKKATPEERTQIQTRMDELSKQKQAADAQKPVVEEAHARVKERENPTEETYAKHYQDLNDQLQTAADNTPTEDINGWNEKRVRILGNHPEDMRLIEEKYPNIGQDSSKWKDLINPLPEKENQTDWRQKFPPSTIEGGTTSPTPQEPWQISPLNARLPADYAKQVSDARSTVWKPEQQEYLRRHLDALANVAKGLSPKETAFLEKLKDADYNNWQNGHSFGLIHSFLDNHIHHIWNLDKNSDFGKSVLLEAQSGSFSKNVQQAKHRTWNLTAEGLLKKLELKNHDPASILESDANHIAEAGANRTVLKTLIKGGLKDSTGMPAVVQRGSGNYDGDSDNLFANPSTIKNVYISPEEVARMTTNGELDTRLKYREVVDQTPQANLDNVGTWIKNIKTQVEKLENKNPLLLDNSPKGGLSDGQHTAAWKQIQTVVQDQATKISDFMDKAVDEIQRTGSFKSPIPPDIALAPYVRKLLSASKVTPEALKRVSDYGDRMQNYADGANSLGDSNIKPSEIARVLYQEKQHLPPELQSYLQEHHDIFAPEGKVPQGEWDPKTMTQLVRLVEDAANNKEYPQLIQDLSDLKQVNHLYTSVNPITAKVNEPAATKLLEDINSRQPKKYLWNPQGHVVPQHPSMNNWTWAGKSPDGVNVMVRGDLAVSPEFYPYLVNSLGLEKSALRSNEGIGRFTKPVLEAGNQAKAILLSGSPFHTLQVMGRALMLGVNPLYRPNAISDVGATFDTVRGPKKLYELGIKNGATLVQDKKAAEEYSLGVSSHSGIVSKIPIYGPYVSAVHSFTFDRLIPSLKADGFRKTFDQYAQRHPDWSDDAVAKHAADHVNNAFGGINWRHMGRSATTQDWFHIVALAPDWLEAEMRSAAGLLQGVGLGAGKYQPDETKNFSRSQVTTMAVLMWSAARLVNTLYSGDPHYDTPFGLSTKDKDGKTVDYSIRTLPTDLIHMISQPKAFISGRLAPGVRSAQELWTGRNQYDQKLTDSEKYADLASNLLPIWGQSGIKSLTGLGTGTDVGLGPQVYKSVGGTAQVHRSTAQQLAANLAAERSEEGAMTPAKIARHRVILRLEDDLRSNKITNEQLESYVDQGSISEADAKEVQKNSRATQGEDSETARMYSRVSRLDLASGFSVYDAASPSEKQVLQKLIAKKAQTYVKSARQKLTPQEKLSDPTFLRARKLISQNEEAPNE